MNKIGTCAGFAAAVLVAALGVALRTSLNAAQPLAEPFDLSRVRLLDGPFKEMQELHRTGLVGHLEPDRLLFGFRRNARLPQPAGVTGGYGGWDGEFIAGHYGGHYLSAAARMYAATGNSGFREKAEYMVSVLAECQAKLGSGYLSAFPADNFDRLETDPHKASVPYYTIHKILAGLLDVHALCDNSQALEVAARMSDYFATRIAKLTPAQVEAMFRTDYLGNPANEFGGMAEALADLYLLASNSGDTNANRHLKLAAVFNRDWFIEPLLQGQDRLSGLHGNTHVAQACGLARYSLATGDARSGQAAETFWRLLVNEHSFVIGGNAFDEKLRAARTEVAGNGDAALSPKTAETCNTHNVLKLSRLLFQREPQAAYADYCELALYNHILASIAPDSGHVTYFTPLRPGDFRTYLDSPYCCQGTGIENTARFGEAIYFHRANTLWINLFIPSTLDWRERGLKLRLETTYPEAGLIRIALEAARRTNATINLRIPSWMTGVADLAINGKRESVATRPGSYLSITRRWRTGDVIELRLPLGLRVRPSRDDPTTVSLFYGPVILAGELGRDKMPASDIAGKDAFVSAPAWPVPVFVSATPDNLSVPVEREADAPLVFYARMADPVDRQEVCVRLAPLHRVHHQRFAVYWKIVAPEQLKTPAVTKVGSLQTDRLRNPVWTSADNLRDPSVLKVHGGYHLFYSRLSASSTGWSDPKNWAIACVFTKDFVHFANDRDISPKGHASPGDVVKWHGRYLLPYQTYPATPTQLCFSESADLHEWSAPKPFLTEARFLPWNGLRRVIDPSLVVDGDTLHCFFVGSANHTNAAGQTIRANLMGHARTRDPKLERWDILTHDAPLLGGSDRAPDGVENTMIFRTGDHWTMIYSEGLARQHLALATSKDLLDWKVEGPIELPSQKWFTRKYGAPFIWREDAHWLLILMGTNDRDRTTFGLLSSTDGQKWTLLPEDSTDF